MMSLSKNGLITTFTLLGLTLVGWVSTTYWWNTQIKPLPEYQLIAVVEAFQQCNMTEFKQAIDLNAVLYGMGEQQVKAELKNHTALTRHFVNSRLVAPFIRKKIQAAITTVEQDITQCSARMNQANSSPFWLMPSLQSLVVFKTVFGIVSLENPKLAEDGQSATFLVRSATGKPKVLEATIQLKKQPNSAHPWQITHVQLSEDLAAIMNQINAKREKTVTKN